MRMIGTPMGVTNVEQVHPCLMGSRRLVPKPDVMERPLGRTQGPDSGGSLKGQPCTEGLRLCALMADIPFGLAVSSFVDRLNS
jgi:hypothetical protein